MTRFLIATAAILGFCNAPVHAQFFSACDSGDEAELDKSIRAHAEHDYRMDRKFLATYYYQGKLPPNFSATAPTDVRQFLAQSSNMRPALLYHAYNETKGRFCAWLMSHNESVVSEVTEIEKARFITLIPRLHRALGIYESTNQRLPVKRNVQPLASSMESKESLAEIISELSNLLLPPSIAKVLGDGSINMLIVVPIYSFGTIPFSLLQIQGKPLVDFMPVFVSPVSSLKQKEADKKATQFSHSIILGDPIAPANADWTFPRLPGAKAEVLEVARIVNARALVDSEATSANLKNLLKRNREVKLIYLATHGVADSKNPLDSSFVLLADGLWSAREIEKLPLKKSRPLVVLSACQTGLGRNFEVGTTGLARAFLNAGAPTVIMSLWSIDDQATKYLMIEFMKFAQQQFPVDVALRLAMQRARVIYPDPVYWAGFSIFGTPILWSE